MALLVLLAQPKGPSQTTKGNGLVSMEDGGLSDALIPSLNSGFIYWHGRWSEGLLRKPKASGHRNDADECYDDKGFP